MSARAVGRFVVTAAVFCLITTGAFAATSLDGLWSNVDEQTLTAFQSGRMIVPKAYATYRADRVALATLLARAPMEFTAAAQLQPLTMSIPMPDGTFQRFRVELSPIVAPGPLGEIATVFAYRGQGIDDPTAYLRLVIVPKAIHAIVLSAHGTTYIDPYSDTTSEHIIAYNKRDFVSNKSFTCEVTGDSYSANSASFGASNAFRIAPDFTDKQRGTVLRNHRLAMAANGEFTQFHHNRPNPYPTAKESAWYKGVIPTVARVTGVYERDLSIRMTLISQTDQFKIIYDNPATDPYSNNTDAIDENKTNLDSVIGTANYDIGHVVTTASGGVAQLSCTCTPNKARGTTGTPQPVGDPFDIDYVAHEMGHQYGGNHTFNGADPNCVSNENPTTAYEVGSGSTIQAYAGICATVPGLSFNLQPNSDPYFHFISLEEIANHTAGAGDCAAKTPTGNTAPTVNAGSDYTIPRSTPFTLTGSATDAETPGSLTYCWEEADLGPPNEGRTDNGASPIFRSFNPTTSPSRAFPRLSDIINNTTTYGEVLPTTPRTMKFKLTVRDNDVRGGAINDGGGTIEDGDVHITVDPTKGPFVVSQPNTQVTWTGGTDQEVTWDVALTNLLTGAANVDIHLSTDGGLTFPTLLLAATPNDGAATIRVPNTPTTTARIRVMASHNVFWDMSNANFTITAAPIGPGSISFQSTSYTVAENGSPATITVRRTGGVAGAVSMTYSTSAGTASTDDYQESTGTVNFADGQETATFTVPVKQDTMVEPGETVTLTLSPPATGGATLGSPSTATLTIADDDSPVQATLTRGPYLQMAGSTSIVIRWRTDIPTDSTVRYGTAAGNLNLLSSSATPTIDHEVTLTGLSPATRYFYTVGAFVHTLGNGDFVTAPFPGAPQPTRIWAFGDSGNANTDQLAIRDSYFTFSPTRRIDVWMLLGDNAYQTGNDVDYQNTFFSRYPNVLKTTPVWSTFGNHEGLSSQSMTQSGPYYQIFTWPTLGEIGGERSGTEAYYSFDYANIHFISLNSHDMLPRTPDSAMMTWLKEDLARNQQKWTIAFFHHPPYSFGGHNSDNTGTPGDTPESAASIKEMREVALPILEQYGVDLVLTGHSHDYERSFLLNGHYGLSSTLTESMKIDRGDGNFAAGRPYRKTSNTSADGNQGAVYAVVGTGSTATPVTKHPVMITAQQRLGSLVIDVQGDRLDAFFLGKATDGTYSKFDEFTILKGYPHAVDDQAVTSRGASVFIDVLANDSDPEGDQIVVSAAPVSAPANGSVVIEGAGVRYTPDADFVGTDSFTYAVRDINGSTDEGTVTVMVTSPAGVFRFDTASYTIDEDAGRVNLTVNRINSAQGAVTVTYVTSDGTATAPADYTAATGFVTFAAGETTKTFSIDITNDATTESPEVFTVTLSNVSDGGIGTPGVAAVAIIDDDVPCAPKPIGSFVDDFEPTPNPGWTVDTPVNGSEPVPSVPGWTHTQDPNAHSTTHSYFSQAAQGVPEALDGSKDDRLVSPPLNISATTQLKFWHSFNHEDTYDGGVIEVSTDGVNWVNLLRDDFVSGGYPEASASAAGSVSWTGISPEYPAMNEVVANLGRFAGNNVRLRWRHVQDPYLGQVGWFVDDVQFTNLNVPGDPPVATDDTSTTALNTPIAINVLANDTDPDGTTLTVREASAGANGGTTVVNPDQTITYTPAAGFSGTDTFTYTAQNVRSCYDVATVSVTVTGGANTAPDAVNDTATTSQNQPVTVNVLTNDTDADSDPLTVTATTQGTNGSVTNTTTTVTYTPNTGFTGSDSFTYTISDGRGGSDTATVNVTVNPPGNNAPDAVNDTATTTQNQPVTVSVLANDTDADGNTLTITAVTNGTSGSVTNTSTTVTYTPNAGFTGADSFTYTISDGAGGSDTATVNVTVTATSSAGSLHFSSATYTVNESGPAATITVTRSAGTAGSVSVAYSTSNGSAAAGSDYTSTFGTLTFADGVTTQTFTVAINNDLADEPDETVTLTLSNPSNGATLGAPATATLTIVDDDAPAGTPAISSISPTTVCQGGPSFTLTVNGSGFQPGAFVQVNGSNRTTTFVSGSQVTATISSADIAAAGARTIHVVNPGPTTSNGVALTVVADTTAPAVTGPAPITVMQTSCSASNDGGASGATSSAVAAFLAAGLASDDCSQGTTRLSPQSGGSDVNNATHFPGGTTTVTFRFRDNAGNIGTATSTVTVRLLGDLNLDVVVDSPDHVILANYLVDNVEPGSAPFTAAAESADLNRDQEIDAVDLVIIANHLVDNIPCLSN